ncbi:MULTISPECIES: glycosyltransferase [unclassified Halomonas]|uniref:glycosyltransferase n=1 Tax=unclassified Halomonas TaxID=2609666 RepID=UPI001C94F683|nr:MULTISPECIES: glycosyltransferase [unclassified Halomonas]MBY5927450.1 glycosyltransferase [Halomonas sp. DP4Y7-2]MBY6234491.1 glycosyltransferase [Halomonas sp. DP4Y7-1]
MTPRLIKRALSRFGKKSEGRPDDRRLVQASGWFDADWYLNQAPVSGRLCAGDAVSHYLSSGVSLGLEPGPAFDGAWYLRAYPDVAAAGINPLVHFLRHGRFEGRLPRQNRALAWEHHLWRGAEDVMLPRLKGLAGSVGSTGAVVPSAASPEEQEYARWALARWSAFRGEGEGKKRWSDVAAWLMPEGRLIAYPVHIGPGLLATEALCRLVLEDDGQASVVSVYRPMAETVLASLASGFASDANLVLAQANWALASGVQGYGEQGCGERDRERSDAERLGLLNAMWQGAGLCALTEDSSAPESGSGKVDGGSGLGFRLGSRLSSGLNFDRLGEMSAALAAGPVASVDSGVLVSVIVPVYNAEATIATALRSLFAQRRVRLEILVVDDASRDATWLVLEGLVAERPEHVALRLLRHHENRGAYAARNTGLEAARGNCVTTHDSDDWSHPDKIMRQVEALEAAPKAMASLSCWVRATDDLLFHRWRVESEGWIYPNISSLMVRRSALSRLGFWDEVSVNADSEYHERLLAAFGPDAVVTALPGTPLAFGRANADSLSQRGETHLATQFVGVRQAYMAAARRWHQRAATADELRLERDTDQRPFVAPSAICRRDLPVSVICEQDRIGGCGYFDGPWYLRRHIDLQQSIIEPLEHYCTSGKQEGRDPGPGFSASGYRYRYRERYPELADRDVDPLHHFLSVGEAEGCEPLPILEGEATPEASAPTVLVCGHLAGEELFGAERSLLDTLVAMRSLGFNLVVSLPAAHNTFYLTRIRSLSLAVAIQPYGWWQRGKSPEAVTVKRFEALITRFGVDALHANTLVLDEPLEAARRAGIPTVVHVRELLEHDPELCQTLDTTPEAMVARVKRQADLIITNSAVTARPFVGDTLAPHDSTPPVCVVPNTAELAPLFALRRDAPATGPLRVGMLSSNLPKKGLTDLERVAECMNRRGDRVVFTLFGPHTPALEALLRRQQGEVSDNATNRTTHRTSTICYGGYVEAPGQALAQLDAVVCLSQFQESFGRTALEAMAAGLPVVGYDWGALPEVVESGQQGYLVPFRDVDAVAERLAWLAARRELGARLGEAGRLRAQDFDLPATARALAEAYRHLPLFRG